MLLKVGDKKIEVDYDEDWDLECPWEPAPKYSFDAEVTIGDSTEHFPYFANEWPEPGDVLYAIAIDAETASESDGFDNFCEMNELEPDENGDNEKALEMYERCMKALDFLDTNQVYFGDIIDAYDNAELDEPLEESINTHPLKTLFESVLEDSDEDDDYDDDDWQGIVGVPSDDQYQRLLKRRDEIKKEIIKKHKEYEPTCDEERQLYYVNHDIEKYEKSIGK